jgi:hypothetical protein
MRNWKFKIDMNNDGLFTISDIWEILTSIFLYPGDLMILLILDTKLEVFFEVSARDYSGTLSFFVSLVTWGTLYALTIGPSHFDHDRRENEGFDQVDDEY